jgi:hydroxylamine dehydrogenase
LSWNLRAPLSDRTNDWEKKLKNMQDVCNSGHGDVFVNGFYQQLNNFVDLYNTQFATPAKEIRDLLMGKGIISKANFDDRIDRIWREQWHH